MRLISTMPAESKWTGFRKTSRKSLAFSLLSVIAIVVMSNVSSNVYATPPIFYIRNAFCYVMICFSGPSGVTVDTTTRVYVADAFNDRIQKFTGTGSYITKWGSYGNGIGEFSIPMDIAVGISGNLFVTDKNNHRIQEFKKDGTFVSTWGTEGTGNGQFSEPSGLVVDKSGNVFAADRELNRIQKFELTTPCPKGATEVASGVCFVTKWGSVGGLKGQFLNPYGLAVDSSGNVFVADYGNHRIQVFRNDGTFVKAWGSYGTGTGQFYNPCGITVDSSDNVFVTDYALHRVQKFRNDGNFVTAWGSKGTGNGQFDSPCGVGTSSSGNVFVTENFNNRIQKFTNDGGYVRKWGTTGPSYAPTLYTCSNILKILDLC